MQFNKSFSVPAFMFALSTDAVAPATAPETAVPDTASFTFPRKQKFRFNSVKDETTGTTTKRPDVEVDVPVLTLSGLVDIIQKGHPTVVGANPQTEDAKNAKKVLDFVIEALGDVVIKEVRGYVADNTNASQDTIPWDKYSFQAIAVMPAGIRGASGIDKALWDSFTKDVVAVSSANNICSAEVAALRVSILVQKFRPLTGNPDRKSIIENLMQFLAVYLEKSTMKEEFASILEFLDKKAEELKKEDTIVTAGALGFA